jgi:hypothetical protein
MSSGFKTSIPSTKSIGSKDSNKISQIYRQFGGKIARCLIRSLLLEAVVSLISPLITRIKGSKEMIVIMARNTTTILKLHMQRKMKEAQTALYQIATHLKTMEIWITAKIPILAMVRGKIASRVILMT